MNNIKTTLLCCLIMTCLLSNAQKVTLSGIVISDSDGEIVPFASCVDISSGKGTTSNNYGHFALLTDVGEVKLTISSVGFDPYCNTIRLCADTSIVVSLHHKETQIKEVTVSTVRSQREHVLMGRQTVTSEQIRAIPSLTGEPDLIKAVSFLPGVNTGKEGYSNIYVRGGDRGQNLFLLDGIKIYSTNHVGGFLSMFNTNIVKKADLYKGGFPAQFGGRTSSIIDIVTKDGSNDNFGFKADVGLLSSGLMIETPIGNKLTFIMAGRTSYYDLFQLKDKHEMQNTGVGSYDNYRFYDVNAKLTWKPNNTHRLSLSFFHGNDMQKFCSRYVAYTGENEYNHSKLTVYNTGLSLTLLSDFGGTFWRNSFSASTYHNNMDDYEESIGKQKRVNEVEIETNIKDLTFQSKIEIERHHNRLKTGLELSAYRFCPGMSHVLKENDIVNDIDSIIGSDKPAKSVEAAVYLSDELTLSDKASIEAGLRTVAYFCRDTNYYRVEPRLAAKYILSPKMSLKANFTVMNQFNHVVVNNNDAMEKEIWLASTRHLKPQHARQVAVGLFYGNEDKKINFSIEAFIKKMNNLIEYHTPIDESESVLSIEQSVNTGGIGRARGIELMAAADIRKLNINLSYTLSKSQRRFKDINFNRWYTFIYDRTHDINLLGLWRFNNNWSASANFALSTGTPVTLPVGYITYDRKNGGYGVYLSVNNYRLPLFHRLDFSTTYERVTPHGHKSKWTANIYNLYARNNATAMFFDRGSGRMRQIAMFSILPTLTYTFTL